MAVEECKERAMLRLTFAVIVQVCLTGSAAGQTIQWISNPTPHLLLDSE